MKVDLLEIRTLIRRLTQRTGPPVFDDDLIQQVALKVVDACRKQTEIRHPHAFLAKIVRDSVHDYWKKRRVAVDISTIDEARLSKLPSFESDLDRRRQAALLHKALAKMQSAKRETLELYYDNDFSIAEISRLQGKSESAVKTELMRTRRALAEMVRDLATKKSRMPR